MISSAFRLRRYRVLALFLVVAIFLFYKSKSAHFSIPTSENLHSGSHIDVDHTVPGDKHIGNLPGGGGVHSPAKLEDEAPTKVQPPTVPGNDISSGHHDDTVLPEEDPKDDGNHWRKSPEHYPIPKESIIPLPKGEPRKIPKVQFDFTTESSSDRNERHKRQSAVKDSFRHAWEGYKKYAWGHDEVRPVSKTFRDPFAGWAATLVDALDTMAIMGLHTEFQEALGYVAKIDFTATTRSEIPVFETTIRYLGGFLGAYDVTGQKHPILLKKAVELADVLYNAFDTPNRMPLLYFNYRPSAVAQKNRANSRAVMSEIGSLSVEFTRLAQLTGNNTYFDAIQRVTDAFDEFQMKSSLPGMWPQIIDISGCKEVQEKVPVGHKKRAAANDDDSHSIAGLALKELSEQVAGEATFVEGDATAPASGPLPPPPANDGVKYETRTVCKPQGIVSPGGQDMYSLGGMADSTYEYLPKQYILLGGLMEQYKTMYEKSFKTFKEKLFFRPLAPKNPDILLSAHVGVSSGSSTPSEKFIPEGSHLTCFVGGMVALGAKIFERPEQLEDARRITDGCVWNYDSTATGIMPETFEMHHCHGKEPCEWDENTWLSKLVTPSDDAIAAAKTRGITLVNQWRVSTVNKRGLSGDLDNIDREQDEKMSHRIASGATDEYSVRSGDKANDSHEGLKKKDVEDAYEKWLKEARQNADNMKLPAGYLNIRDTRYILRPEAIESVFYMYRITGDKEWQNKGWRMWEAIEKHTKTSTAHSAINDVTNKKPTQMDEMESFWLAETLKYFYLLFSEPDVISLDDYVLNTEAHPFLRPKASTV